MANKYVDTTATYNGDGTLSTQASAAGEPGAWNNLRNCFLNVPGYGSIAAGDMVYVRSADAAGTPITVSFGTTSTTMVTNATEDLPVTWITDDGTVWPYGGQLTVSHGSGSSSAGITFADFNNFVGNMRFLSGYTSTSSSLLLVFANQVFNGTTFEQTTAVSQTSAGYYRNGSAKYTIMIDPVFVLRRGAYSGAVLVGDISCMHLTNPTFDCSEAASSLQTLFNFSTTSQRASRLRILGGNVIGALETHRLLSVSANVQADGEIVGLKTGLMSMVPATFEAGYNGQFRIHVSQRDDTYQSMAMLDSVGLVEWSGGKNYPTLNSLLNGTDIYWSYKIYPAAAKKGRPIALPAVIKYYNNNSAINKITLELLAAETFTGLTKENVHMDVFYIDADGESKCISTFDPLTPLASSTSGWTATVYGEKNYNKYKIDVDTETAIKQGSFVYAIVHIGISSISVDDFFFVDPDITFTALS